MSANLGSSSNEHRRDAVKYALEAQRQARHAVKGARAGACDRALNAYHSAQQALGASTAELYHVEGRLGVPEHGRAQRWITAAHRAFKSRCMVKR